jgi:hypothetical protein
MHKRLHFIVLLMSIITISGYSQNEHKFSHRNSFHLELGGTAGYYSVNYERNLINLSRFKTSGQLGFGYLPGECCDLRIPAGIIEQISFTNHHIEIGIGYMSVRELTRDDMGALNRIWTDILTGRIGYRFQKPDGRLILKIGFTPLLQRERPGLNYNPNAPFKVFAPMGGVSVGYAW